MATDWQATWQALNERQQQYLRALFDLDQEAEAYYRDGWSLARRGPPPKPSEWRWIRYGTEQPDDAPPLKTYLYMLELVDQGTGATWKALDTRGYVVREWRPEEVMTPRGVERQAALYVQITPVGRKLIRGVDPTAPRPPRQRRVPTGMLNEEKWSALAYVYRAGVKGVPAQARKAERLAAALWWLCEREEPPLVEDEWDINPEDSWRERMRWYITAAGVAFYEHHWAAHRALHPSVTAVKPNPKKRWVAEEQ